MTYRTQRRTVIAVLAAMLCAVLVVTAAPHAMAFDRDQWAQQMKQRVLGARAPGSALKQSSQSTTSIQRVAGVRRHVGASGPDKGVTIPQTGKSQAGKFGRIAKGTGVAATAAFGFDVAYNVTGGIMGQVFGIESNGFWCDVSELVGTNDCTVGIAPEYVANADVTVTAPGWVVNQYVGAITTSNNTYLGDSVVVATVDSPLSIADGSGTLSVRLLPVDTFGSGSYVGNAYRVVKDSDNNTGCSGGSGGGRGNFLPSGYVRNVNVTNTAPGCLWHFEVAGSSSDWGTSNVAKWYPVGHVSRPTEPDANPERAWETRWTCSEGPGGVQRSATFREADTPWPAFPEASCPGGALLTLVEVWEVTLNGSVEDALIASWTPTQGQADWQDEYPECLDGSCRLELFRLDPTAPGERVSCLGNPAACLDWYYDPNKADKYECQYAGAVIALDECRVYGPTFNVLTNTPVQTEDGTTRRPDETQVHGDPATGEPQPKPEGSPETTPAPEGCPPPFEFTLGGFGYWVTKGGICAIQATFVPPPGLIASEVEATIDVVRTRPPWTLLGPVTGTIGGLAEGWTTGCMLLPDADPYGNGLRIPCDPPSSDWMTALKAISVIAVVAGTAFGIWHMLVGAIGGGKVND